MKIKIFKDDYNKSEFYGIIGKYFAERKYRNEMPYMINKDGKVWFVAMKNDEVIGFAAIYIENKKGMIESNYVEEKHRNNGVFTKLIEKMMDYIGGKVDILEIATNKEYLIDFWIKRGFGESRKKGSYQYLTKEIV